MHISNILFAFMTGAAVVMAAPATGGNDGLKPRNDCPNGWVKCGECNGTSCKFAGTNRNCATGSCTAQSGAGDGATCGTHDPMGVEMECPGSS
ncbi:hypothetical protein BDW42DRAFT_197646 [Aspergillus taichungensis]|uniref:Uncharacterized protein n=1 Tax=Aspergillus taichungensis TaxID=482145 RepID=A0A2J5HFD7_9EURO|nr:hypothetical protein BDW42DRAFT_197646 [Aspergillus taichungensis]